MKLVSFFFIPSRFLSYAKIAKGESRKPNLFEFYAKTHLNSLNIKGGDCFIL